MITAKGNIVTRPRNHASSFIHDYLNFLHKNGFKEVPKPVLLDTDYEKLTYVEGDVYEEVLSNLRTTDCLSAVADLLRRYHDISTKYIPYLTEQEQWLLPIRYPIEVMCHGDFASYNIAFQDGKPNGIFDFDTVHPGPRIWDVAYASYRWIPLTSSSNPEDFGTEQEKLQRLDVFLEAYGFAGINRLDIIMTAIKRVQSLVTYMKEEAANGNQQFIDDIQSGHILVYESDIKFMNRILKDL